MPIFTLKIIFIFPHFAYIFVLAVKPIAGRRDSFSLKIFNNHRLCLKQI